jgi:DNA invertase Pin-like site-specific DNA recombinase
MVGNVHLLAGIRFGRKPKLTLYQRKEALERLADGESQLAIARTMGVDRSTISRVQSI